MILKQLIYYQKVETFDPYSLPPDFQQLTTHKATMKSICVRKCDLHRLACSSDSCAYFLSTRYRTIGHSLFPQPVRFPSRWSLDASRNFGISSISSLILSTGADQTSPDLTEEMVPFCRSRSISLRINRRRDGANWRVLR